MSLARPARASSARPGLDGVAGRGRARRGVLGLGAALAQARYVGRRVTREMARAICLSGSGDCRRDQEPCVVAVAGHRQGMTVRPALRPARARTLGAGRGALRRHVRGHAGGRHHGRLGGGGRADGRASRRQARPLARRRGHRRGAWHAGARPDVDRRLARRRRSGSSSSDGAGRRAGSRRRGRARGELVGRRQRGRRARWGRRSRSARAGLAFDAKRAGASTGAAGHRTAYVQASATASATVGGGVLGLSGDGREIYAVEFDADGRPLDLRVIATGTFAGSRDLPGGRRSRWPACWRRDAGEGRAATRSPAISI